MSLPLYAKDFMPSKINNTAFSLAKVDRDRAGDTRQLTGQVYNQGKTYSLEDDKSRDHFTIKDAIRLTYI
jgi:hypothetical protein